MKVEVVIGELKWMVWLGRCRWTNEGLGSRAVPSDCQLLDVASAFGFISQHASSWVYRKYILIVFLLIRNRLILVY